MMRTSPGGTAATSRGRRERPGPAQPAATARGATAARRALAANAALALLLVPGVAPAGRGWIDDPSGRAALQVSFRYAPTYEDLAEAQAALTRAAALVCDATEGQVRIEQIRLVASPVSEDLSALWLHDDAAASGGPYDAAGGDLRRLGAHMDVFESARLRPDRLAHLLGHHAFGLGDQYDDQRRRGEACGVGPGFETARLDEQNHSIMQAAGGMRCGQGPMAGDECLRDDQCGGARCEAVLSSEWSAPSNHDLVRGDGRACPSPSPLSRVRLSGLLPVGAEPLGAFDAKDFLSARATSVWHRQMEVLGENGRLPGVRLQFWLSHTARQQWQLTVGADASEFGGEAGTLRVLRSWALAFHDDFSLASVTPAELRFPLPSTSGRGPVEVAVDVGTRSPGDSTRSGEGYDGLQMIAAGRTDLDLDVDGVVGCSAAWCASSWNETDGRWETAEQTLLHDGASDWQTIVANHPFLSVPSGGPVEAAPAVCATPPEFLTDVMGAEQVVLVLDTSRTMGLRVDGRAGEVCANGEDDDDDGASDEADCADSRLEYERVAVRAFLELVQRRKAQVGFVTMDTDAEAVAAVDEVGPARAAVLEAVLGGLRAGGDTAMGTALERAQESLQKVERVGRSRTVVLMTDGASNVGVPPGQERRVVDPLRYRVFPVAVGAASDRKTLSAVAARSGGVVYPAADAASLPAVLAELAARHEGSALVLGRTPFSLSRGGKGADASREFAIPVEEYARELTVFLSSRNPRVDDWRLLFELDGPGGRRIDEQSAEATVERGFVVVRVSDPEPGAWRLRVLAGAAGEQGSEALAWTTHRQADLFVDADPRLASSSRAVRIVARPAYVADIDGDVSLEAEVRRPDGTGTTVALARDPFTRAWGADFQAFAGRGLYEVRVRLKVGRGARPALGEPVFPGPSRPLIRVVPFEREATASFYVADGPPAACSAADCDGDGLADKLEAGCIDDVDGDGMPSARDADADNDELLDGEEGTRDLDHDGLADFCDPQSTPSSLGFAIEAEERAVAAACDANAAADRDTLRSSLESVRRIVQALRVHDRIAPAQRDELVAALERVIELKKQAVVIGEVLPEFCGKYQSRLQEALAIEREIRVRVDPWLAR